MSLEETEQEDAGFVVIVRAFGLDEAAQEALFDRVADAAHELDEQVFCSAGSEAPST